MRESGSWLLSILLGLPCFAQVDARVYASRRARLAAETPDALIVVAGRNLVGEEGLWKQDPNFWYLTGVESPYAILVLTPPSRSVLFVPHPYQFAGAQYPMEDERFRRAPWNRPRRPAPVGFSEIRGIDEFAASLKDLAAGATAVAMPLDSARVYAPPGMPAPLTATQQFTRGVEALLPGKPVRDISPVLARMRLIKDATEIAALRRAAEISGEGLVAAMRAVRPGLNDREVAGLMEYVWKRAGSPRAAFTPIVASGPDAMTLFTLRRESYDSPNHVMRAGELLFLDYGAAEYAGYAADLCRTIPVSGRFTGTQRRYYDMVLEAQEAAIAAVRPGVMMLDVVRAAAQVFRKHGLERYEDIGVMGEDRVWGVMPSPTHYLARNGGLVRYSAQGYGVRDLGHHIGLEPTESRDYSRPLEPGMVFTVEPKIYIPGETIAIMIEDMVLVTPQGHEVLAAKTPKRAVEIERLMRGKQVGQAILSPALPRVDLQAVAIGRRQDRPPHKSP